MERHVFSSDRPDLVIRCVRTEKLGNCYYATTYSVESKSRRLTKEDLTTLYKLGLLGYGQDFRVISKCDSKVEAAIRDETPCVLSTTGDPCGNPKHAPSTVPVYVYECETRVDSSD